MRGKHVIRAISGAARRPQRAALGQAEGSGQQCGDFSTNWSLVMSCTEYAKGSSGQHAEAEQQAGRIAYIRTRQAFAGCSPLGFLVGYHLAGSVPGRRDQAARQTDMIHCIP